MQMRTYYLNVLYICGLIGISCALTHPFELLTKENRNILYWDLQRVDDDLEHVLTDEAGNW